MCNSHIGDPPDKNRLGGKRKSLLRRTNRSALLVWLSIQLTLQLVAPVYAQRPLQFPVTPKHPITDEYNGNKVSDDYRWLEDLTDPAVRQWVEEQNKFTRSI